MGIAEAIASTSDWLQQWGKPLEPRLMCWAEPDNPGFGTPVNVTIKVVDLYTHVPVLNSTANIANPVRLWHTEDGETHVAWESKTVPTNQEFSFLFRRLFDAWTDQAYYPAASVEAPGYPPQPVAFGWEESLAALRDEAEEVAPMPVTGESESLPQ